MEQHKISLYKYLYDILGSLEDLQEFLQVSQVLTDSFLEKPDKLDRFFNSMEELKFDGRVAVKDKTGKLWKDTILGSISLENLNNGDIDTFIDYLIKLKLQKEKEGFKNIRLRSSSYQRVTMTLEAHKLETDEEYEQRINYYKKLEEEKQKKEKIKREKRYQEYLQLKAEFEDSGIENHPLFPDEIK